MPENPAKARLFLDQNMAEADLVPFVGGTTGVFCARSPTKEGGNEDAAALLPFGENSGVLAVTDGLGGAPAGDEAAKLTLQALQESLAQTAAAGGELRDAILDGIERANRAVKELGVGAGTTLVLAEIEDYKVRSYHVGDSHLLVVGQRGKIRSLTVAHSPVGYAVEAGLLDAKEALYHEDRHLLSNMIGAPDMHIEVGSMIRLKPRDTLLLATDGLFDNLHVEEIVEMIRKGRLKKVTRLLRERALSRMLAPGETQPSKPDDITFIVYRREFRRRSGPERPATAPPSPGVQLPAPGGPPPLQPREGPVLAPESPVHPPQGPVNPPEETAHPPDSPVDPREPI